jgi:hypothetical protein
MLLFNHLFKSVFSSVHGGPSFLQATRTIAPQQKRSIGASSAAA